MKIMVEIAEVHKSIREIEVSDNATDAEIWDVAAKDAGEAYEIGFEYSHTLDPETWVIRRDNGDYVKRGL